MKISKLMKLVEQIMDESVPLGQRIKNTYILRSYMLSFLLTQPIDESLVEKIREERELFADIIPPFKGKDIIELFEWFKEATKIRQVADEKYGATYENLSEWAKRVAIISLSILTHVEVLTPEEEELGEVTGEASPEA